MVQTGGAGAVQVIVGQEAIMATPAMSALIRNRHIYGKPDLWSLFCCFTCGSISNSGARGSAWAGLAASSRSRHFRSSLLKG
jgi:hypothetical protein